MKFKSFLNSTLDWLKYFSLNFFHNKYAREGARRSTLNVLAGIAIAFVLLCGGLTIGYNGSFKTHYDNAGGFKQFLNEDLKGVSLAIEDGKLTSDVNIETFVSGSDYRVNGYELVIDTRPVATTYNDFTIEVKDKDGKEMTYDEYMKLPSEDMRKCTLSLKYGDKLLDTAERQDIYRAYLDKVSTKGDDYIESIDSEYSNIKSMEEKGELAGYELYNAIYRLYARAYYPSFEKVEKYATVPTMRSYYLSKVAEIESHKYLLLFDDSCYCAFETDGGINVSFSSDYGGMDGKIGSADELIIGAFESNGAVNFMVFASSSIISLVIFVIIMFMLAFVGMNIMKSHNIDYATGSTGLFNVIGGFLPVSGIIAFIFGIALPYAMSVNAAYLAVRLIFLAVVVARFAVLVTMDLLKSKKEAPAPVPAPEAPADPFGEEPAAAEPTAEETDAQAEPTAPPTDDKE